MVQTIIRLIYTNLLGINHQWQKKILVTGGAGFVGTNLIKYLLLRTNFQIISIDNYSSGLKNNHVKNKRVKYINGETRDISKIIKNTRDIKTVFHFGEFARIYQSFLKNE